MTHLKLLKFSRKGRDGMVSVESAQEMTDSWFEEKIRLLQTAFENIRIALDYERHEFT